MFVKKIKSPGLAHLSYLLISGNEAAVIDPGLDVDKYFKVARENSCTITAVFETHRHEDFISGGPRLAEIFGVPVYHGAKSDSPIVYASEVVQGDSFQFDEIKLKVLAAPGHTRDSICLAVYENGLKSPVAVFTGDLLFSGDVGRTDFYPGREKEMAQVQFESLQKLKELGNQTIIYPAHGAGSACGNNISSREISTLGIELQQNSWMKFENADEFAAEKIKLSKGKTPYFSKMEKLNTRGFTDSTRYDYLLPLSVADFKKLASESEIIDVRSTSAFLGCHYPGSLAIPPEKISDIVSCCFDPEQSLLLIADSSSQVREVSTLLWQIGFHNLRGYLEVSFMRWVAAGGSWSNLPGIGVNEVAARLQKKPDNWSLLDIREKEEFETTKIAGSLSFPLSGLKNQLHQLDKKSKYTVMCGSGVRAVVGASFLLSHGFEKVEVFAGSLGAWLASGR
ncbi:MAG: MBL fold metallo-hydrolase [Myxococcota bacterium]